MPLTRRHLLHRALGATTILGTGAEAAHARFLAPFHPVLEQVTIPLPTLPPAFDGLRIVHLSDLHIQDGFPASCLEPALELVRSAKPDLIILTGDYQYDRNHHGDSEMTACAQALRSLPALAPLGVYAVYGNHDYPPAPAQPNEGIWRAVGITTLRNRRAEVMRGADRIFLMGLDSLLSRPAIPSAVMAGVPKGACVLSLWHEPDWAMMVAACGASLQLSGHTHGGQVVLPWVGPPVLPPFGRLYPAGLYQVGRMPLYVTRGVGLLHPFVRINCPPEVTLLILRSGATLAETKVG